MSVPLVMMRTSIGVNMGRDGRIPRLVMRCITSFMLKMAQNQKMDMAFMMTFQ